MRGRRTGTRRRTWRWMSGLLVLSTLDAALGLRALVRLRLRRKFAWLWMAATAAWALLAIVVVAVLLRG